MKIFTQDGNQYITIKSCKYHAQKEISSTVPKDPIDDL